MLAYMCGLEGSVLFKQVWLCTFPMELRKPVATAGLTNLDDIAARADRIQETIRGEQVADIESSHKVLSFCSQCGGKPKGSN